MLNWLINKLKMLYEISKIPAVKLSLGGYEDFYFSFTARHPKCPLFRRKVIGVALIPIIDDFDSYISSINGKNSAAYYARKATKNGYEFREFDPNHYLEDIYNINTSKEYRQGHLMNEAYTKKIDYIELQSNIHYYGVFSSNGQLVAYAWVHHCGDIWIINTLLGHAQHLNNGVMYMLITNVVLEMFKDPEDRRSKFLMYDTWYGAQSGLQMFKKKLGFKPYRVKWVL